MFYDSEWQPRFLFYLYRLHPGGMEAADGLDEFLPQYGEVGKEVHLLHFADVAQPVGGEVVERLERSGGDGGRGLGTARREQAELGAGEQVVDERMEVERHCLKHLRRKCGKLERQLLCPFGVVGGGIVEDGRQEWQQVGVGVGHAACFDKLQGGERAGELPERGVYLVGSIETALVLDDGYELCAEAGIDGVAVGKPLQVAGDGDSLQPFGRDAAAQAAGMSVEVLQDGVVIGILYDEREGDLLGYPCKVLERFAAGEPIQLPAHAVADEAHPYHSGAQPSGGHLTDVFYQLLIDVWRKLLPRVGDAVLFPLYDESDTLFHVSLVFWFLS